MTAQAREYFESLAIETMIKEDPVKRDAWIKRQLALELFDTSTPEPIGSALEE
jgi:hypothetical protein